MLDTTGIAEAITTRLGPMNLSAAMGTLQDIFRGRAHVQVRILGVRILIQDREEEGLWAEIGFQEQEGAWVFLEPAGRPLSDLAHIGEE